MRVSAWFPAPWLSLALLLVWLFLNDSLAPGQILLGGLLGFLIPLFTNRFWPEPARLRRPFLFVRFVWLVLFDIVVANFQLVPVILGPSRAVKPVFIRVPLEVADELAITVLAAAITLTPGTVAAEVDPDRRFILVHAVNQGDPAALCDKIKTRYESLVKEIFAC